MSTYAAIIGSSQSSVSNLRSSSPHACAPVIFANSSEGPAPPAQASSLDKHRVGRASSEALHGLAK